MPNGVRHPVGVVVGLVLTPLIAVGLMFGTDRFSRVYQVFDFSGSSKWSAAITVVAVAAAVGLAVGSRMSPLASLIPGIAFTAIGLLWVLAPEFALEHTTRKLPNTLDRGYALLGPYGILLMVGVLLVVASLPGSRWAAAAPRSPAGPPPQFGGPIPPYGQAVPPPQHQMPQPQHQMPPLPHRQPGQNPLHGPPPGVGAPPAQYQPTGSPPPAYSPPPASGSSTPPVPEQRSSAPDRASDDDAGEAGGWTQMYGTGGSGKKDD